MAVERVDPNPASGEAAFKEYVDIPNVGFVSFDPNTLAINGDNATDGVKHPNTPVSLPERFVGTKQPHVATCSEPVPGNRGCPKWAGCPMKAYPYVGPGPVIMRDRGIGPPNFAMCYDYYETTRGGRATSQMHYGMDGWKLDLTRTTIEVLGRTGAISSGKLGDESSRQAVVYSKPKVWEKEIPGLLPPWWPLMKKKGLELPASAKRYPELAEEEPVEEEAPRAAYRGVRKRSPRKS